MLYLTVKMHGLKTSAPELRMLGEPTRMHCPGDLHSQCPPCNVGDDATEKMCVQKESVKPKKLSLEELCIRYSSNKTAARAQVVTR